MFNYKAKARDSGIGGFDDATKEAFRSRYEKIDAELNAQPEAAPEISNDDNTRIYLKTGYDGKDAVKGKGAKFDSASKKWYITGSMYHNDTAFWDAQGIDTIADLSACPF